MSTLSVRYRTYDSPEPNTFQAQLRPEGFIELHVNAKVTDVAPTKAALIFACIRDRMSGTLPRGIYTMRRVGAGELVIYGVKLENHQHALKTNLHLVNVPAKTADLWVQFGLQASFSPGVSF